MAIFRKINTSFWQDPLILDLTPEQKYFYLYLMTNTKTNQCGIYEISKQIMVFETGYNSDTIDKLLNIFIDNGRILFSEKTNEIMLLNWTTPLEMKELLSQYLTVLILNLDLMGLFNLNL